MRLNDLARDEDANIYLLCPTRTGISEIKWSRLVLFIVTFGLAPELPSLQGRIAIIPVGGRKRVEIISIFECRCFAGDYRRSGSGGTACPQCPAKSHVLTPKNTLSFDTGSVAALLVNEAPYFVAAAKNCQSLAAVSRQTIW